MSKKQDLLTVVLAAGTSRRFSEAGFALPKPRLPMPDGRSLIEWQIERLGVDDLLYVGHADHQRAIMNKLIGIMKQPWCPGILSPCFFKEYTLGPLASAWKIRSWLEYDREILIIYCDILPRHGFIKYFLKHCRLRECDAAVVGFESSAARFTRVPGHEMACSGIFYFQNGKELVKRMRAQPRGENNGLPDMVYRHDYWRWVATLYKHDIVDLGVPSEYFRWMAEQGSPVDRETWRIR